jgi:16S rRNA (guanine966-N2)-methyltransferase
MTLKITSGKYKGRILSAPKDIRPATGFVRDAIFNICQNQIEEANFLDLFAGSGAIGLEALSRGAKFATFVDKSYVSIRFIKENITKLNVQNFSKVFCEDVLEYVKRCNEKFDIVSIDPPFVIYKDNPSYINELLNKLSFNIHENSIIFLEEPTYSKRPSDIENLILKNKRKYSSAYLLEYILK